MSKKLKPTEKKKICRELLVPLALLLIGLVLIVESAEVMVLLAGISLPTTSMLTMGYVYLFLKFIAGLIAMISGIVILRK